MTYNKDYSVYSLSLRALAHSANSAPMLADTTAAVEDLCLKTRALRSNQMNLRVAMISVLQALRSVGCNWATSVGHESWRASFPVGVKWCSRLRSSTSNQTDFANAHWMSMWCESSAS